MTTITEAVKAALDAYAPLQALVGNGDSPETYRIHPILAPQDTAKPFVVFHKVSGERLKTMADSGGTGVENMRYRISCYDEQIIDAQAVADNVRKALAAAATISAWHVFETDDYEIDTGLYHVTQDYSIWYK